MTENITTSLRDDGILVAVIDMPGRPMNVFSPGLIDALDGLLAQVAADDQISGVVITSGKPAFLAGADLDMVLGFTSKAASASQAELVALCGQLSAQFLRIESSPKPFVAALNGLALGGGLELTLACHGRVAVDDPKLQLGLPESKLGLLPGAGGTQRLPRMVGLDHAVPMLLRGTSVNPARALEIGLVDQVVPPAALIETAAQLAKVLVGVKKSWAHNDFGLDLSASDAAERLAAKADLSDAERQENPAHDVILRCLTGGLVRNLVEACAWEVDRFIDLIRNPAVGNMVRTLFIDRRRAERTFNRLGDFAVTEVALAGDVASLQRDLAAARIAVGSGTPQVAILTKDSESPSAFACAVGIFASAPSSHGRAIEIVVEREDPEAERVALSMAKRLRGTPLVTHGKRSVLAALAAVPSTERDAVARDLLGESLIADPGLADVAVVAGGLYPASSGGPFSQARS